VSVFDVRAVSTAVFGSGANGRVRLTEWDAAIRGGLSTTRRVGVMSLTPGAGASTVAHQLTRAIAGRRSEPVLAVDVSTGATGLAARLGAAPVPPDETRAAARTTAEALSGLSEQDGVVTLRPRHTDDAVGAWLGEAAPIARFFDVAVTDFGPRHPLVDLAGCAALCDVVCLVSDARRAAAEHARSVVGAVRGLPESPSLVLALVDHGREGDGVARAFATGADHTVVPIPFDAGLAAGGRARRSATHLAVVRLAAAVVGATGRSE
jgi:MinD-like ATPase involved in chromosome partitioning or flagellar assembly